MDFCSQGAVSTHTTVLLQVRVCTRMGVNLVSTDFKSRDYYSNIRKAITSGYFMQANPTAETHVAIAKRIRDHARGGSHIVTGLSSKASGAGRAPRADRSLLDREGQSDGAPASVHVPGPQARVVRSTAIPCMSDLPRSSVLARPD